jgi:3-phenylpropionate/trans-cinnamate dioxygenase ferredoxin subunit
MERIKVFSSNGEMRERLKEGAPQHLMVNGQSICMVLWKGELRAVENKCPHNGESLSKGKINYLGEVICPLHGYRFNLKNGREAGERCRDAETFPVNENDEGVFVGL